MEDDQQFCLKWNNHQSTLIQNFDTLYESGTLVDCTLAAEGKYLKAHRVVLSACSPYFEGLLSEHYDKHPVFILKDVKFKELKAMMDYMYRGEVNISQDQLTALLKAAESLQIKGLSESKTGGGNNKTVSRVSKVAPQPRSSPLNISYASSGLTIERNRVPRQAQSSIGDLPEDSHSPQIPKELSSREGSQSPTSKKRRRLRRRSVGEDNSVENHEASNSSDIPQQMGVPALAIAPVADEKTNADPTDSLGRSALMTQLTKPADEMLQIPLENPEPNDNLIEPKSEYLEDQEESVEDLTLDDDMNDLNEIEQDTNRAGPSHDNSQHPAGLATWHVTGDRSNAGGVVGSVAGAPGTTDEVFLAAQEAAQAHRDSQGENTKGNVTDENHHHDEDSEICEVPFHGQLTMNYLLCDSSILNPVEPSVVQSRNSSSSGSSKPCQQFRCDGCGRTYTRVDSLKRHQQKCDDLLASLQDRQENLERLQQQEYSCNQCDIMEDTKDYDALWMLEKKARSIGEDQESFLVPMRSKVPEQAGPSYPIAQLYGGESYIAVLQAQYVCTDCGKKYKWQDSLKRHQRVDCGNKEKKFACNVCDRKFKYRYELKNHITAHHRT
ncbi:longitudinals lacking protein, isoforms F/I/K/T-like isoform X10 [Vespa mandarinia]|uniref:longitudinals lacking protein, isoforms F/I/K/T-like isoform X10 n=1 Tax=Vespa mandarinia TaxID=7446 RepID=UPI00160B8DAF|nr:longitudinals lacking protein, isoforms F/I/K/T-like isoform X10 [Vespa mandarinia]XP_047360925.1 longitudinals lacking protein, isoforms F/I/K/T-like isoform X5 [Vespa velutina]